MKTRLFAASAAVTLAVQALFFAVLLFLRPVLAVGDGFFHVLTPEEWDWLVAQPAAIPNETKVVAIVTGLKVLLLAATLLCIALQYARRPLIRRMLLLPLLWLAAYLPVFFAVRRAAHYYLWMTLLPLEFFSLLLLTVMLLRRQKKAQ